MEQIVVRPERAEDIAAIFAVQTATFGQANEAKLVDALRAAGKATLSLVAVQGERIVGHVLFSPVTVTTPAGPVEGIGLAPVGVLPPEQARGIGKALIEAGLAECRKCGYRFAVVLGNPAYYRRFGFFRAANANLTNDYGVDEEFMVLALQPSGLPVGGHVRYAEEFATVAS